MAMRDGFVAVCLAAAVGCHGGAPSSPAGNGGGGGASGSGASGGGAGGGAAADTGPVRFVGSTSGLTAVACSSAASCLAVGTGSDVVGSKGRIWQPFVPAQAILPSLSDVLWDGHRYVAVSTSHVVVRSPDGVTFDEQIDQNASFRALAWSGSVYVGVGTLGTIFTSPDTTTWTARTSGTTENLNGVAWSGNKFVAVGEKGSILTSPDGVTWTSRLAGAGSSLAAVASSGTKLVAVGVGPSFTSPDGMTWTQGAAVAGSGSASAVAWSKPLGLFAAVGSSGAIATSPDGATWTARTGPRSVDLSGVTWTGDRFVAVGGAGAIVGSADGVTWTTESFSTRFLGVSWAGGQFVAMSFEDIWHSADGLGWTQGRVSSGGVWYEVVAPPGGGYVMSGVGFTTSPDLATWSQPFSVGTATSCHGLAWTGAALVAACTDGAAFQSTDGGATWKGTLIDGSDAGSLDSWEDVAWTGARLVAVGDRGVVATSTDGESWTLGASGTTANLRAVAWSGQALVAVGDGGAAIGSPDGSTWTALTTGSTQALNDIAWAGDRFVAVGESQTILQSPDGATWTRVKPPDGLYDSLLAVAASPDRVVVVGNPGLILALPLPLAP
jgi:hypothetical protein